MQTSNAKDAAKIAIMAFATTDQASECPTTVAAVACAIRVAGSLTDGEVESLEALRAEDGTFAPRRLIAALCLFAGLRLERLMRMPLEKSLARPELEAQGIRIPQERLRGEAARV